MKKGIKSRLINSYLLLIIVTVLLFETLLLSALRLYYEDGVKHTLRDQGTMFSVLYGQEIQQGAFLNHPSMLLEKYQYHVDAHVQLYNLEGKKIADSFNDLSDQSYDSLDDVHAALLGDTKYYKGKFNNQGILAVSEPIIVEDQIYGVIRLITTTDNLNMVFKKNFLFLGGIGLIVILIAFSISYILATTITKPLQHITAGAEKMAQGKFSTRINKSRDDELGKLTDTLNYMAEQVEKHEKLKNEFIASVSHELRTPLTSVKGWAITLKSMTEDPIYSEGLDIIANESERLSFMLNDLLDLSTLTSGRVEYKFEQVEIGSLIREATKQLRPRAERQGTLLTLCDPETMLVKGDWNRLKQVLVNILDNALKFTSKGDEITVSFQKTPQQAIIQIKDTGVGIEEEDLKLIKERFYKGKHRASGTGLGLAICQEIIDAHGGNLLIDSQLGVGTKVEIQLPLGS